MDCFLMEGIKVFYRITIGILNHFIKMETSVESLKEGIAENCRAIQVKYSVSVSVK